jgi:hypothetical protein
MIERILTALLGPRCAHGCGQRVFPRDAAAHHRLNHAGDQP